MKKRTLLRVSLGILTIGVISLSGCQKAASKSETTVTAEAAAETVTESTAAEEKPLFGSFQTITLDGEEISEEIFSQAGLSMVNIWGTYCPPCVEEMPDLAELSEEYGGADFQMLGLVVDVAEAGDKEAVAIVEQTGADYTHMLYCDELRSNYLNKVQAVPTTIFLDKEGRQVGRVYMGARSKAQWEEIIQELLAETTES